MEQENSTDIPKRDFSISLGRANLYALLFVLPLAAPFVLLFIAFWGAPTLMKGLFTFMNPRFFLPALVFGAIVHEIIHGISWAYFGKKSWRAMKFGIEWKSLTPYAHCTEPMEVNAYRIGSAMPGVVLGIIPTALAIATGFGPLLVFGVLFTIAAGGDITVIWVLRKVDAGKLVEDHPKRAGCYVLE